jgi:hypothetical protein
VRWEERIQMINDIKYNKNGWGDWRIANIEDQNKKTGFCACTIETGKNAAIVAFRGRESYGANRFAKDWMMTNLSLPNNYMGAIHHPFYRINHSPR